MAMYFSSIRHVLSSLYSNLGTAFYLFEILLIFTCSICGSNLGPLFTKIAFPRASDAELSNKVAEMSCQIDDYELLVLQLKVCLHNIQSR